MFFKVRLLFKNVHYWREYGSYTLLFHDNDTLLVKVVRRGGLMRDRPTFKNLHPYCENSNDVPENHANRSKTL